MSILVEIAEKAHVSVEGVLRVLTREPVSDAIKERVLAVLDDLDAEQNRILQRFALAALHDALPRPGDAEDVVGEEVDEGGQALLPPGPEPAAALPVAAPDTAHLVQLSAVLEELAGAVRDLRQETDVERRERVDDLAVLIELISTGWQGLDRRLGRLERQIGRLEARPQPVQAAPVTAAPPSQPPPPAAPPPVAARPTPEPSARTKRDRLPLAAAIALVAVVVGTLAVLQLVAGEPEVDGLSSRGSDFLEAVADEPATTETARTTNAATTSAVTTTAPTRTAAPPPLRRPAPPPTTSAVLGTGTTVAAPQPAPPRTQTTAPRPPTTTAPGAAEPSGFLPTRDWAWAPVAEADYYSVQFLRGGRGLYRTWTENTRIRLPDSVVFRPGSYRWVIRPGFGERSAGRLGPPIVDSSFTVQ